ASCSVGASINPEMKVKPKTARTPHPVLRRAATRNSEPNIAAIMSSGAMIGDAWKNAAKLSDIPTKAPATVGSIDSASSQYVLRRTLFGATAGTVTEPGIVHRACDSPVVTGLNCGSMESLSRNPD